VPATTIGTVGAESGTLEITHHGDIFRVLVKELRDLYLDAIPRRMDTVG
jgi:hypothetical protein